MKKILCMMLFTILIASIFVSFSAEPKLAWADTPPVSSADIAITSVTCSQSFVEQGFTATITANVENSGTSTENFDVTFSVNDIVVSTQTVTLVSGSSTIVFCEWNTTGFALGDYVLSASAWPVAGETTASSDTCTGSTIMVTCLGDLTGQGEVDSTSFFAFVDAYISYYSGGQYNPAADFEHNGDITSVDFFDFVSAYIAYWAGPTPFIHNGGLTLTLSDSQTVYAPGVPVDFTLSINNVSDKTISFCYTGGLFDYIVYNATGIVYRYSFGVAFPMFARIISLAPGTSFTQSFTWDQVCNLDSIRASPCILIPTTLCPVFLASPGAYYIVSEALGMQTVPYQITIVSATT